jgi:hypothetical protein
MPQNSLGDDNTLNVRQLTPVKGGGVSLGDVNMKPQGVM